MSVHRKRQGERAQLLARNFLLKHDFEIVKENWRSAREYKGAGEVDILASKSHLTVLLFRDPPLLREGLRAVSNRKELVTISLMKALRATGLSYEKIAAELTPRKIPTQSGKVKWCAATIHKILTREDKIA